MPTYLTPHYPRTYKNAFPSFDALKLMKEEMTNELDPQIFKKFVLLMGKAINPQVFRKHPTNILQR
jgi:HD-GYP domain-containing protein (c-di-GMP phosphodiesterase class II)